MPTASGRYLFNRLNARRIPIGRCNFGLQGKRNLIGIGTLVQIAVWSPKTGVARACAIVAYTVAVTVVEACPQFTCGGVPTCIALAHEILQTTANAMAITILGTDHFATVIAFPI